MAGVALGDIGLRFGTYLGLGWLGLVALGAPWSPLTPVTLWSFMLALGLRFA